MKGTERAMTRDGSKTPVPPHILERARELRSNGTRAERLIFDPLTILNKVHGLKLIYQQPLRHSRGYCYADFYSWPARLDIELDGRHHADPAQAAHDRERTELLKMDCQIEVVRLTNEEVIADAYSATLKIGRECLKRMGKEGDLISREELEALTEERICLRLGLPT